MKEKNYDASFGAASGSALEVFVTVLGTTRLVLVYFINAHRIGVDVYARPEVSSWVVVANT